MVTYNDKNSTLDKGLINFSDLIDSISRKKTRDQYVPSCAAMQNSTTVVYKGDTDVILLLIYVVLLLKNLIANVADSNVSLQHQMLI